MTTIAGSHGSVEDGVVDRRGFGIGKQASTFTPDIRLNLAMRARRVVADISTDR
jgi:hypothetical protein